MASSVGAPVTLHLVRHGIAVGAEGRCIGHTDLPLAPAGRDALAELAARWPLPRVAHLVSSDLARARESAQVLAEAWGVPIREDARLREMDFGRWDGRTWEELERDDADAFAEWMAHWEHARTPGGEGFGDVITRVGEWVADAVRAARAEEMGEVVVVAHAGSIRALLVQVTGIGRGEAFGVKVEHGGVVTVGIEGGRG